MLLNEFINKDNELRELISEIIRQCRKKDQDDRPLSKQKWCLFSKDGNRLLGRHSSKEDAKKQEIAIQIRKHNL
ncbi:MAG: hypothetical protein AABY07_07250 [Nanoarchaeota archaeon]|mgnify:CR=1 FL=1